MMTAHTERELLQQPRGKVGRTSQGLRHRWGVCVCVRVCQRKREREILWTSKIYSAEW